MNVPAPKFMIEGTWRGRLFGAEWHNAAGGSLDVLEPATGATLTRVGNATAADVRKAFVGTSYMREKMVATLTRAAEAYDRKRFDEALRLGRIVADAVLGMTI